MTDEAKKQYIASVEAVIDSAPEQIQKNIEESAEFIAAAAEQGLVIPSELIARILGIAFFEGMCHCFRQCQAARVDGSLGCY